MRPTWPFSSQLLFRSTGKMRLDPALPQFSHTLRPHSSDPECNGLGEEGGSRV
jgi:hypothetical protein